MTRILQVHGFLDRPRAAAHVMPEWGWRERTGPVGRPDHTSMCTLVWDCCTGDTIVDM